MAITLSVGRACKMHDMAVHCYLKAGCEKKVALLPDLLLGLMQGPQQLRFFYSTHTTLDILPVQMDGATFHPKV